MKTQNFVKRERIAVRVTETILAAVLLPILLAGCGAGVQSGSESGSGTNTPPSPAKVVVVISSTADDRLASYTLGIDSILLSDREGNSTQLYSTSNPSEAFSEWIHLNGSAEPLVSTAAPQGTYTSASIRLGGCSFTILGYDAPDVTIATYAQGTCAQGTGVATVKLPQPITISGPVAVLSLELEEQQSYTLTTGGNTTYTISPAFTLTTLPLSESPTNQQNGKLSGIFAEVESVTADSKQFMAETLDQGSFTFSTNGSTVYEGIADFSSLTEGLPVSLDASIQPDGSLLATRIEVDDASAPEATIGPYLNPIIGKLDGFSNYSVLYEGCTVVGTPIICGNVFQFQDTTQFNVSKEFSNLSSLPFTPTFTNTTFFPGQNLSVYSPGTFNDVNLIDASTVTLYPQTLNGGVSAVTNVNGFAVYTVQLAPYDLFSQLQQQGGTIPILSNPKTVFVYADTNTQFLNSGVVNVGSLIRVRGLVFDDNGTLRMDCSDVFDGVPQ